MEEVVGALHRVPLAPLQRLEVFVDTEAEPPVLGLPLPLHDLKVSLLDGGGGSLGLVAGAS
jgi:hypothetical protein